MITQEQIAELKYCARKRPLTSSEIVDLFDHIAALEARVAREDAVNGVTELEVLESEVRRLRQIIEARNGTIAELTQQRDDMRIAMLQAQDNAAALKVQVAAGKESTDGNN